MKKKTVNIGNQVFNVSTKEWEKVIKIEPIKSGISKHTTAYKTIGITHQVRTEKGNTFNITPKLKVRKLVKLNLGDKIHVWNLDNDYIGRGEIIGTGGKSFKNGSFIIQIEGHEKLIWSDKLSYVLESELLDIAEKIREKK